MSTLLWILAVLDLIGGIVIGVELDSLVLGISIGIVGFAILGGFATVVSLLETVSSNTTSILNKISAEIAEIQQVRRTDQASNTKSKTAPELAEKQQAENNDHTSNVKNTVITETKESRQDRNSYQTSPINGNIHRVLNQTNRQKLFTVHNVLFSSSDEHYYASLDIISNNGTAPSGITASIILKGTSKEIGRLDSIRFSGFEPNDRGHLVSDMIPIAVTDMIMSSADSFEVIVEEYSDGGNVVTVR